jgi:cell division protein FtsI (penicillin-binding protein 3)
MLVVIDEPQTTIWGGTAAAPVFRSIALAAAERLGIELPGVATKEPNAPSREIVHAEEPSEDGNASTSFLGLSLREALDRARAAGIALEVRGSGYVVRQDPPPGKPATADRPVRLDLAAGGSLG